MKFYSILLGLTISFFVFANLMAQDLNEEDTKQGLSEFLIIITTNERGFEMECKEGCNWKNLSFNSYTIQNGEVFYKKAIVDETGVGGYYMSSDAPSEQNIKGDNNFAFIVRQTEDGVFFESVKGTAWEKLSYRCIKPNCVQAIDEMGMIELDSMK